MFRDDEIRLHHMLDAAREAVSFARHRVRSDMETDRQLVLSLVKDIEIVGEAASQVSDSFRTQSPEIDWQNMIAMRNRLVHAYFSINLDIVWQTVKEDLPRLITQLERIVPPDSGPD